MAGSAEYYGRYLEHLRNVDKYDRWKKTIADINRTLVNDFSDNVDAVNRNIDDLRADLEDSVRHNAIFDDNKDIFISRKEKKIGSSDEKFSDSNLSGAREALTSEVERLQGKRDAEQKAADEDYANYKRALEEEAEARRQAMKNLLHL